jgi:hypothetical protein
VLNFIHGHGKLLDIVAKWHQEKLNASLKKACMLGSYKIAILIIRAGANNFKQCIQECTQKNRINHILAYLRLCQAAFEDDQTAIDILLEGDEDKVSGHPRFPSLVDYSTILLPLIDNGTLTITEPLHVALKANHQTTAGKILQCSSKKHFHGMVDWHGLELTELEPSWLKGDYSSMQLLCLSFNSLKQIPSQVCNFTSLVKLQVAFNRLTFVPSIVFQMPCIENIDLSYNSIASLPDALIGRVSPSLHILTLSSNQLSRFPDYFIESSLQNLDLSKNRFMVVPESIYSIKLLESLNMSQNPDIRIIPYELGGLKHLKVTSFDGLPYTFNVPNDSLMEFIRKRFKSMKTVSNYQASLIGFSRHSQTLHSVHDNLLRSGLDCSFLKFDSNTRFLNLHHIFKSPNMLHILVWDCVNSQAPNDLHRVLRHLSIHDPDSPVIVAACWTNFESQLEADIEALISTSLWKDLRDRVHLEHFILPRYEEGFVTVEDVINPYSFQALVNCVSKVADKVVLTQFIPGSYYSCGENLGKMREAFLEVKKCPMLSEDEFWEVVSSMPLNDLCGRGELPQLLSYLSQIGSVLYVQGGMGLESYCVINCQWFCTVLGNVLSRQAAQVIQSVSGVVHQEVLVDLLGCPCLTLPLPHALQYMLNKNAVALALSSEKWLIPSMLAETPDHSANVGPEQFGIRRQYTFNLTPANFWSRLITHLLMNMEKLVQEVSDVSRSESPSTLNAPGGRHFSSLPRRGYSTLPRQGVVDWSYWKRGIMCWQNACHLVYSIESLGVCTDPYQETIEIRVPNNVTGYRVMHRLSLIVDSLLKNWYPEVWASVEIWVPCSYCVHTGVPDVPSISFQDCILAVSKGVGVRCMKHVEKITSIKKIIPDLIQEDVSIDCFLPPGSVEFCVSDKSTCLSPPPAETVFKGKYSELLVAVKPFPHRKIRGMKGDETPTDQSSPPLLQMWSEFEIFRHLQASKCPFIIQLLGVCPDPLCLVFPFARWSSLDDVFHTKDIIIPHLVRMKMIYQLASALSVLQSYKVIHRNICLANLLVFSLSADDAVNIKLAGFSNACYSIFQGIGVGQLGTFPAPEMVLASGGEYDERVDIFAFAFVAYEIVTQTRIHAALSRQPIPNREQSSTSLCPSLEPVRVRAPYLVTLLSKCWQTDRTKRPFASKVVDLLKQPLHMLTRDGHLVNEEHEFFAASARFTRVQNNFHPDLFVSSGQLMGSRSNFLSRESLPGLSFESFKQLPVEFVICMGCIGSQLWISFYGKTVRVYSALTMEFINEFTFNYHVVAMAISPTSVYMGLENGVLQVYDVSDSIPTEPSLTKIVDAGEEFKCIEALEDSVVCAMKSSIHCLHPDTLDVEEMWNLQCKDEIRCIVISRCAGVEDEESGEGNDLLWVAFRRWDLVLVMNPWTGQQYYTVDCATILKEPESRVYIQSLRAVLDTVWIGLNTGHILVFASNHMKPRLLTHFKVFKDGVRQLLLLHPSYTGPTTVLSTTEIVKSLRTSQTSLMADQKLTFPDSVSVVSFGNGLDSPLCSVDRHGGVTDTETDSNGLFAVVMEAANVSRMTHVERNSDRPPLLYMEGYYDTEDNLYEVPPDDIVTCESPRRLFPSDKSRTDTWSAEQSGSPVSLDHYQRISPRGGAFCSSSESGSSSSGTFSQAHSGTPPPSLPPRDTPSTRQPKGPLYKIVGSLSKLGKKTPTKSSPPPLPPNVAETGPTREESPHDKRLPEPADEEEERGSEENEEDDDFEYAYAYQDLSLVRAQTYTLPNLKMSKTAPPTRRLTYDDRSRPDIEDSAEDYDPYVRMDSLFGTQSRDLRVTANKAKKKAKIKKRDLSVVSEEDFVPREDFLGGAVGRLEKELELDKPVKKLKPKVPMKPPSLLPR